MRKLGLALASFLLVVLWAIFHPGGSRSTIAQTYSQQTYTQQMMHSHEGDRPIASEVVAAAPSVPVSAETVTYGMIDGKPITGYLARPADATAPLPGLIVIHEWWGLNENIEMMTQRLAGEGYTALAVDLHDDRVAETPEQARELVQAALQNPERLERNLLQAYQYLEDDQQAPKIGSIGWCFGGTWSLNTALLLPEQLDATVVYYGGQITTDPEKLSSLKMPILGLFGALDDNPPVATVRQFEAALKSLNKAAEIHIYEGADHAFANPSGTRYNAEAAADSWERTTTFLDRHLK